MRTRRVRRTQVGSRPEGSVIRVRRAVLSGAERSSHGGPLESSRPTPAGSGLSATSLGRVAVNVRFTRSAGRAAASSAIVVLNRRPRTAPWSPISRISRGDAAASHPDALSRQLPPDFADAIPCHGPEDLVGTGCFPKRGRSSAIGIVVADRFAVNAGVGARVPNEQDSRDDWRSLPLRSGDATQKSASVVYSGAVKWAWRVCR